MKNITTKYQHLQKTIREIERRFGRVENSVQLIAASKTKPIEDIQLAVACGQQHFAENYLQEGIEKIKRINNPKLIWHFIGNLQANKCKHIATNFDWVHGISRIKIALRLNALRPAQLPPINACIQVNINHQKNKSGVSAEELTELVDSCVSLPRIRLRGLMALPAPATDFPAQRIPFRQLQAMLTALRKDYPQLDTLSMGTSKDMEAAIAEGSTIIRIGTRLFGIRNT